MSFCMQASFPLIFHQHRKNTPWTDVRLDGHPLHPRPQSRAATDPQAQEASLNAHCWFPWRLWGCLLRSQLLSMLHDTVPHIMKKEKVKVVQSCVTLYEPLACSPPGSSVHGILQARVLEWVVIPFSRGSSQPGD